jgi:hypothetical protein
MPKNKIHFDRYPLPTKKPEHLYYNFGYWQNLGADPKELMPKCCEGGSGGGNNGGGDITPTGPTPNIITLIPEKTTGWAITVTPQKAPTSTLSVTINYKYDGTANTETFTLNSGSLNTSWPLTATTNTATTVTIDSVTFVPASDATYDYVAANGTPVVTYPNIYYGVIPHAQASVTSTTGLSNITPKSGSNTMSFTVKAASVVGYNTMNETDAAAAATNNAQDFVILYDATKITNYQIYNSIGIDTTTTWISNGTMVNGSTTYTVLRHSDTNTQTHPYDSTTTKPDDLIFSYDFEIS